METLKDKELTSREVVMLGAGSLNAFGKLMHARTFRQDSPPFHLEIGDDLYSNARYNSFMVFRDGAKTSLLRVYTSQRIAYAVSRTIMYVSGSQQHAAMSVRWMRRQIMYNKKLTQTYKLRKGEKWTDEHCEIFHGIDDTPITLLAMGITGQIRGFNPDDYRPDLIILDDVLNEENCATAEQRKKIEALIFGALYNSLAPATEAPHAKMVFLQTPLNKEDAINKSMKDPQWNGRIFGVFDAEGKSRWESRWPTETMLKEKEGFIARGQYALWMREKECKVVGSGQKPFDVSRLKIYEAGMHPKGMIKIISIDPASSDSKTADDNVVMCIGVSGPDVYVLQYEADTGVMPDQVAMQFFQMAIEFKPQRCAVEVISYQRILAWFLEEEMKKRRIFIPMDKVQDKRSKATRIVQTLAGLVSYGHLYIQSTMTKLITQMDEFDPEDMSQHDDILDALATGVTSITPHLRLGLEEGDDSYELDESDYEILDFGGCP